MCLIFQNTVVSSVTLELGFLRGLYIRKTKRMLFYWKTEHFKALTNIYHTSTLVNHVRLTGHQQK